MTNESIRTSIFGKLNSSWASWVTSCKIAWPNMDFKPELQRAWIRPAIKIPMTTVEELGSDGQGLRDGLLMISVFIPSGTGQKAAFTWADRLERIFRRLDLGDLWFDEPSSNDAGTDVNGFNHTLMSVDFHCWVGE